MVSDALLLLIDIQNDFLPGGALAVPGAEAIISPVNALIPHFSHIVATRDWHPEGHCSFKEREGNWPPHCIQGAFGAELSDKLLLPSYTVILDKGSAIDTDSYSAIFDEKGQSATRLRTLIEEWGSHTLYVCGLATDYCVGQTCRDALRLGFQVVLVGDACRGIDSKAAQHVIDTVSSHPHGKVLSHREILASFGA